MARIVSLFRRAGNSSRRSSQTTEFAHIFGTVFRSNQRIPEEFAVVSLLAGAQNNQRRRRNSPALPRRRPLHDRRRIDPARQGAVVMRAPALQPGAAERVRDYARRIAYDDAGLQAQRQPVAEIAGPGLEIIGVAQ